MKASTYGYCPICGAPGKSRERRLNGNDICENGHAYPSNDSAESELYQIHDVAGVRDMLAQADLPPGEDRVAWYDSIRKRFPDAKLEVVSEHSPHFFVTRA